MGPACQTSLLLAFQSGIWATFPPRRTVPYTPSWSAVPGSTLLHSAFMWWETCLEMWSPEKCVVLWIRGKACSSWEAPCPVSEAVNPPWLRLSERPWNHKPLRRQSLCPWRGHCPCPIYFTLLDPEPDQLANDGQDSSREG